MVPEGHIPLRQQAALYTYDGPSMSTVAKEAMQDAIHREFRRRQEIKMRIRMTELYRRNATLNATMRKKRKAARFEKRQLERMTDRLRLLQLQCGDGMQPLRLSLSSLSIDVSSSSKTP